MSNSVVDDRAGSARPRVQDAYKKALAHSARVRRLKVLLPVAALAISMSFIAVSAVRAFLPENLKIESARIENGKVVMEKPAVSGRNSDGINYSMRAERALQDIKNPNIISLEDINAAVPVNDKLIARVEALSGIFDRATDKLDLDKPFTVRMSSGLEAKFQSAHLDIKGGNLIADTPVAISNESMSIVAQSLKMTDKGRIITFAGNVRMNANPSTIRKQDTKTPDPS
ncbi:LPS export ABC transporter periplasmic protein LptC [Rhizobium sp. RU36D]|uniref:LPS export ABC transporter periplasmic protein LptC n=1 Tax=Rhizobium sp. RU36D TaxID=1907415 RepID=UPI0009D8FD96|nr:LPS export ABC transporter periplasmic protein LptC [Rhizobium sp. RU36D]SMD04596.1 lipopolysaccharide export system protein LptC [Rhizobium sp. RU36D]